MSTRALRGFVQLQDEPVRSLPGWGHPRSSPARRWAELGPHGAYMVRHRSWLDHLYRLRFANGTTVYRAEPYWLTEDDLDELGLLREDGWRVELGGAHCHDPSTVVVSIRART
jgi:hypothetical protein